MVRKIGKYELMQTLGTGTFGKVKYAVDSKDPNRTAYAIKVMDRKQIEKENMQDQLRNEVAIMKLLNHRNIVKMYEVIQSLDHIYIVLELVTGGELFDRIVAAKRFDEPTGRKYFQQLIFGVHYCHVQGVVHRDLKPENLLLDANGILKISDFGLSAFSSSGGEDKLLMTTCGTPNYVSPEVLKEKGYSGYGADVWSCGIILYVLLAGYLPFEDPTTNGLFTKIERGEYRMAKQFTPPVKNLIAQILVVDPQKRITMKGILQDPWFMIDADEKELAWHMNPSEKIVVPANAAASSLGETVALHETAEQNGPNAADGDAGAADEKRSDLTAFELASQLVMGSLSPLITRTDYVYIRRNMRFMMSGNVQASMDRITAELKKMGYNPSAGKTGYLIKGFFNASKGIVTFSFLLFTTVCKELVLVECRRTRGDTLEFHKFYRKIIAALKDVVPCQPSAADDFDKEEGSPAHSYAPAAKPPPSPLTGQAVANGPSAAAAVGPTPNNN